MRLFSVPPAHVESQMGSFVVSLLGKYCVNGNAPIASIYIKLPLLGLTVED